MMMAILLSSSVIFAQDYATIKADNYARQMLEQHGPTEVVPDAPPGSSRAIGDDCITPIVVNTTDLPYSDLGQTTCGRLNTYSNTALGSYDGGEDIIYELVLTDQVELFFTLTTTATWTGMGLFDDCPGLGGPSIIQTTSSSGNKSFSQLLDAGTYYLMIDTWPTPNCIASFNLTIAPPPPGAACSTALTYGNVNDPPVTGSITSGGAVWYEVNCASEYIATVSLCNSAYDTKVEVWYDCGDAAYTYYNDDSYWCTGSYSVYSALENVTLAAGTNYIKVYGFGSSSGNYELEITGVPNIPMIMGYVLNGGGQTIANANLLIVENGRTSTTDPTGYYEFWGIPDGTYTLEVTKTGYNPATASLTITGGIAVTQDFTLMAPNITVSPLIFDETLHPNEYMTTYLSLLNTGDGILNWAAGIVFPMPPPPQSAVSIPALNSEKGERQAGSDAVAERPGYISGGHGMPGPSNSGLRGSIAFGYEAWYVDDLFDFDVDDVENGNFIPASPWPGTLYGMVFPRGEEDFVYATVSASNNLYEIERATGLVTNLGVLTGSLPTTGFFDLTVDPTTGIIYGTGDDNLYIIDPLGMTSTYIGYMGTNVDFVLAIGCDAAGDMWAYDIGWDWFYSVDKNTGNATDVGYLGVNTNYTGTMFYDEATDNILITTYNLSTFDAEVRVVDRSTGATSILSTWYDSWFTAAALPVGGGGGGPSGGWLTLDTYSGIVLPGGGTENIGVNFDASGTTAGEVYTADIVISTNPFVGEITVPVTMTIAGDPFPVISGFTAELTDAVTGEVTLMWNSFREPTLDYYIIYRNGAPLTTTDNSTYVDMLPGFGTYDYELQPVFLEGSGVMVGPETVEWYEPELCYDNYAENTQWVDQLQEVTVEFENCATEGVLYYEFPEGQCAYDYTLRLTDDFGDGWNGGTISLMVDGVVVISGVTCSGYGPNDFTFSVEDGPEITTTYTAGSWSYENVYQILDCSG